MAVRRLHQNAWLIKSSNALYNVIRSASTTSSSTIDQETVKSFNDLPSPGGIYDVPYIGSALFFKPFTQFTPASIHLLFRDFHKKHGDIVKFRAGKDWMVLLFNPDHIQEMSMIPLKTPFRPPLKLLSAYYKRKNTVASIGLLNGEEWASFRKPAQDQILKPAIVANYVPLINNVTDDFVAKLKTVTSIDCIEEFYRYTTESVGMLCFNKRLGCFDEETSDLNIMPSIKQYFTALNASSFAILHPYAYFRTPMYNKFEAAADTVYGVVETMIKQRKEEDMDGKTIEGSPTNEEPNLLNTLLMDPRLTPEKVGRLMQDLFAGGVDSTASALTFLLFNLSKYPEKQELLYEEISSRMSKSEPVTKEILGNMPYLKACVKESLRIYYPVAGGVFRHFDHDIAIGGYTIPKKTGILGTGSAISVMDKYYTNSKDFVPERWLRDSNEYNQQKIHPFAQLPFGFGVRKCIGQRFAENKIYVAMIKMINHFKFTLPSEMESLDYDYQNLRSTKTTSKVTNRTESMISAM